MSNKIIFLTKKIYLNLIILIFLNYESFIFAAPGDGGTGGPFDNDPGVSSALPSVIKILQFLGVLLVKWISPLLGAYLLASGCWVGAMGQGQEKDSWKSKVMFGGCLITIRVFISMFTTWLS